MTDVVVDSSVVLKWFRSEDERHAGAAESVRQSFRSGQLTIYAPDLIYLEVLSVAARSWRFDGQRLQHVVIALRTLGFRRVETDLQRVAEWCARGLTAYDAAYVSAGEVVGAPVITDDEPMCRIAAGIAQPLATFAG